MALTYLLKINGNDIVKVKEFVVKRPKITTKAGRNMAGELKFTFVGIFPNLQLKFAVMTADEMSDLVALLDLPSFTVSYWDEKTQGYKSGTFYAGDFELSLMDKEKLLYNEFAVTLIPFKKVT